MSSLCMATTRFVVGDFWLLFLCLVDGRVMQCHTCTCTANTIITCTFGKSLFRATLYMYIVDISLV